MLKLHENWREIAKHAWSVRLMIVAALLSGGEVCIQVIVGFNIHTPIPGGILAALAGLTTIAATMARFIAQQKLKVSL